MKILSVHPLFPLQGKFSLCLLVALHASFFLYLDTYIHCYKYKVQTGQQQQLSCDCERVSKEGLRTSN